MRVWLPSDKKDVLTTSFPLPSNMPLKIMLEPSSRLILPVGMIPGPLAVTVIVKVTACPNTVGVPELARLTVAVAGFTFCDKVADEPPTSIELPLYTAVSG